MAMRPWPAVPEEHRWTIESAEEMLENTTQTPEQLSVRARELRGDAEATDIKGFRDAWIALAERYEALAASRLRRAGS